MKTLRTIFEQGSVFRSHASLLDEALGGTSRNCRWMPQPVVATCL